MELSREIYWNIPRFLIALHYGLFIVASVIFALGVFRHYKLWKIGKSSPQFNHYLARIRGFIVYVFLQRGVLRRTTGGIIHGLIFYGFSLLYIGTLLVLVQADLGIVFLAGTFYLYFSLAMDLAGLAFILGLGLAFIRRYIIGSRDLDNIFDDLATLFLFTTIALTGFLLEGLRLNVTEWNTNPALMDWSPFGKLTAWLTIWLGLTEPVIKQWHAIIWFIHSSLVLVFIGYIPFSKLWHMFSGPLNIFFSSRWTGEHPGTLPKIDLENTDSFGVSTLKDFTWKDLLDFDACTRCGRCQTNCPTHVSEKPLSPKKLILDLKNHWLSARGGSAFGGQEGKKNIPDKSNSGYIAGSVITDDTIWACTTCHNCVEQCPVLIKQMDKILELRRYLVLSESRFPAEVKTMFKNMETNGNPWPVGRDQRSNWAKNLDIAVLRSDSGVPSQTGRSDSPAGSGVNSVPSQAGEPRRMSGNEQKKETDLLFWIGCAGATDDRNIKVTQALVNILKKAGIDFAILGNEERCCGDPARRIGNEYLFHLLAEENIATLKKYKFNRILTYCPHCYNTLKNEYHQFEADFKVVHHSEILAELLNRGQIKLNKPLKQIMTYHDSCYLGRYNNIYQQPRQVLSQIPGVNLKEMKRHKVNSFCCGGGGGRMWMEEKLGARINQIRTQEAIDSQAKIIGTACPYCLTMLTDGIKEKEATGLAAKDIAELVNESL